MKRTDIIEAPRIDADSVLCFIEGEKNVPFPIKRVFHISGVREGSVRGNHAHHVLQEVVFCIQGSVEVDTIDGAGNSQSILLDAPQVGLFLPPSVWRVLHSFSKDAILLVVASTDYDPDDYIRSTEEFEVTWGK